MELEEAAEILRVWAGRKRVIDRLWLFGSRVPGSGKIPRPDSDLDIAVDMAFADWLFFAPCLRASVRNLPLPWTVHVLPYDIPSLGRSGNVRAAVDRYGRLVFQKESG